MQKLCEWMRWTDGLCPGTWKLKSVPVKLHNFVIIFVQYTLVVTMSDNLKCCLLWYQINIPTIAKHKKFVCFDSLDIIFFSYPSSIIITRDYCILQNQTKKKLRGVCTEWGSKQLNHQSVRSSAPVVNRWLWPGNRAFLEISNMSGYLVDSDFFAQWWYIEHHGQTRWKWVTVLVKIVESEESSNSYEDYKSNFKLCLNVSGLHRMASTWLVSWV